MANLSSFRSLGMLLSRRSFAGFLSSPRSPSGSRWIFNAFSSSSENNDSAKESKEEEKIKTEDVGDGEKLLAEKENMIAEKDKELKDMRVGMMQ